MDIDWVVTLWLGLVVLIATTVHSITGFGTGQITMGVLPFFRGTGSASIVVSIIVFITNLRVFWSVRDEFNWKDWIIPVAGLAIGLPIGIYLYGAWDEDQLRVAIGVVMMISAVVILLVRQIKWIREWIKGTGWQPGWISGVLAETNISNERIGDITLVQAVSDNSVLEEIEVSFDGTQISNVESRLHTLWLEEFPEDEKVARQVEALRAPYQDTLEEVIAIAGEPLGRHYRSESPLDKLVGEIICAETGAEIAFMPGGVWGDTAARTDHAGSALHTYPSSCQVGNDAVDR